ncbi:hypothetical protein [Glycomyces xiaoerkulensis]|uniref:hypothetical protein n=1 Tax=Glycomyces xiaoerkulensis TaxID=2038139 RepID=UPI000C26A49E|nr:hypothetical protein [Glycomyces xiaoerkulensis]
MIDHGIDRCPGEEECESCEDDGYLLIVEFESPVGLLCLTLCESCRELGELPSLGWGTAVRKVMAHCEHRGVDGDFDLRQREAEAS